MAFLTLEDLSGNVEIVVFPNVYEKAYKILEQEAVVLIKGRASISAEDTGKVIASEIELLQQPQQNGAVLGLVLTEDTKATLQDVTSVLYKYHGNLPVYIHDQKRQQKFKADSKYWIKEDDLLLKELHMLLGEDNVILKRKNMI